MKNLCKSIISSAVAAAMCLTMGMSAFAAEDTETTYNETVFKHTATLYEPEKRDNFKCGFPYQVFGNVSKDASVSSATAKELTMMAFADLDTLTESTKQTTEKGDTEATGKLTITKTENAAMYSLFNKEKKVWGNPKYIHPSSEGWQVESVELESDGTSIYAMCTESKIETLSVDDYDSINLFAEKIPAMQIALYKYSEETSSFVPIKLFSQEYACLAMPCLTFEDDFMVMSWVSVPCLSVAEMIAGAGKVDLKFSKCEKGKWSEEETIASLDYDNFMSYALLSDNNGLYFTLFYSDDNNEYIGVVNDKKEILFSGNVKLNGPVTKGTLPDGSNAVYFVSESDLFCLSKEDDKTSLTAIYKNIGSVEALYVSDLSNILYVNEKDQCTLMEIEYNSKSNSYNDACSVFTTKGSITNVISSPISDSEMVLLMAEGTEDDLAGLKEQDKEYCGANIYFSLLDKKESADKSNADKSNSSSEKTTADNEKTTKDNAVPTHKEVESATVAEGMPDTGSSTSIAVFAAFGIAIVAFSMVRKKKSE